MGASPSKSKPDRSTGLSEHEKKEVQTVWRAFTKAHRDDYGVVLLTSLFTAHPDYLQLFEKYKHLDIEQLRKDEKFRSLGCTVGNNLNNQIELLNDPDNMLRVVKKNAAFHARVTGVTAEHFANFGKVIINVLKTKHEHLMTPTATSAWEKLFHSLNEHVSPIFASKGLASMSFANTSRFTSPSSHEAGKGAGVQRMQSLASTKPRVKKEEAAEDAPAAQRQPSSHKLASASKAGKETSPTSNQAGKARPQRSRSAAASKSRIKKE